MDILQPYYFVLTMNAIIQALDPASLLFFLSFTPWGFGFAFYGFQLPLIINLF